AVNPFQILYSRQIYIESTVSTIILFAILLFWEGVIKNRSLKVVALGGVVFGLALDSKYITLVLAVAILVFTVLYRNRIPGGFPRRELLVYYSVGLLMFVPVILDLAANNVNPFYFDLVGRFQIHSSSGGGIARALGSGGGGGQLIYIGFRNFIQTFFRFSPTNPLMVYPASAIDIPVWVVVAILVFVFFVGAFLFRRNPREGMLLILFVAFLGFAFTYPGKRTYFTLYPMLIFIVMLGGLCQISVDRLRVTRAPNPRTFLALALVGLTLTGVAINAAGTPVTHQSGFGDWDDVTPIVSYINLNHGPNSYVAVNLALVGYYIARDNVNVSIAWMDQEQYY
ncbi:MAG TPA: glycosyltransferase family 39 protein, partial [Nitrososphaerales archaeon]|nr:glycosyltransferase family 39 protein [Nitrososphaerales archaeon]